MEQQQVVEVKVVEAKVEEFVPRAKGYDNFDAFFADVQAYAVTQCTAVRKKVNNLKGKGFGRAVCSCEGQAVATLGKRKRTTSRCGCGWFVECKLREGDGKYYYHRSHLTHTGHVPSKLPVVRVSRKAPGVTFPLHVLQAGYEEVKKGAKPRQLKPVLEEHMPNIELNPHILTNFKSRCLRYGRRKEKNNNKSGSSTSSGNSTGGSSK